MPDKRGTDNRGSTVQSSVSISRLQAVTALQKGGGTLQEK